MINLPEISRAADTLIESLTDEALVDPIHWLSKERQSIPMQAAAKLPMREPSRVPRKLAPISFFQRVKDAASSLRDKASASYHNVHPDALPIAPKAIDQIKLREPTGPAGPLTGKPRFSATARPPHRDRMIKHDGQLVRSHVHSKSYPGVSFPTPYVEPSARHELPKAEKPLDMRKVRRTRSRNATKKKITKYAGKGKGSKPKGPALGRRLADMNHDMGSMEWVDRMLGKTPAMT